MSAASVKREIYRSLNELVCLPQCLVGQNILIDMRNETSVAGKITNVDGFMTIFMKNAVYIDELGKHYQMEEFMIYPRCVRYIHIPETITIVPALEEHIAKMTARKPKNPTKMTFKIKRARQYQQQTLAENKMV
ncbi:U7 snRNA-associated Sm-like protein LSm10 [Sabethes cyaneus]|uniref:U7 snRNA-associated Sm-like protein LSm10 n=1 Tax=Sabethes cyaneus TaxID=53552 RepID=UPI00237DB2FF|nr:U7 snRNA-associated Sm-like protein LSm10 [Sabethes cyaneus]